MLPRWTEAPAAAVRLAPGAGAVAMERASPTAARQAGVGQVDPNGEVLPSRPRRLPLCRRQHRLSQRRRRPIGRTVSSPGATGLSG